MADEIGKLAVSLSLDDDQFNSSMSGVNRSLKVLGSELQAIRAKGAEYGNSIDGLAQRQDALGRTMSVQQAKVDQLRAAYERSAAETGQYSEKSQRLAAQLNKSVAELNRTETELGQVTSALARQQAEVNQTVSVWEKMQSSLDQAGAKLQEVGGKMKDIGGNMTAGVTTAFAAFGAAAVKSAVDVDSSQGRIQAQLGLTEAESEKVNQAAQNLYKQGFGENMQNAADNVANVAKNMRDIPKDDLQGVAQQAMTISDVFGQDINDVTKTANTLMKNFGISSTEAFDLMTTGFQNGLDYSGEFLDTLNEYSPQFSALGFGGKEFFNSLASGAEAGAFNLDKVGDAVKEFNIRAKDGSKTTGESFKALGMDADKMAATFAKGGPEAQKAFTKVVSELQKIEDPVKRNTIGVGLFGTQFEDLENDVVAALGKTTGEFDKVDGATKKAGQAVTDNLGARATVAFREFQTALEPLGEVLVNLAETIMPKLQSAIKVISDAFSGLSPTGQMLTVAFGLISAAMGPVLVAFGFVAQAIGGLIPVFAKLLPFISRLGPAFTIIRTGLMALTGPVGIAIAILTGLGILIYKNWDTIKEKTSEFFTTMGSYFSTGWTTISETVSGFFTTVGSYFSTGWTAITSGVTSFFTTLGTYFTTGWEFIKQTASTAMSGLVTILSTIWNGIKTAATVVFDALKAYFTTVFNFYKTIFTTVWDGIKAAVTLVWNGIKTAATVVFDALKAYFTTVFNIYKTIFTTVWNAIKSVVTTVINGIKTVVTNVFNAVKSTITTIFNGIKSTATTVWNAIKSAITTVVNGIKTTVTNVWNAIKSTVTSVMNGIKTAVTNAWNSIKSAVTTVVNGIKTTVTNVWNAIKSTVSDVMSGIKTAVTNAWNSIKTAVTNAVNGIKTAVSNAWNAIKTAVSNVMNSIKSTVTDAWNSVKSSVTNAVNGIKTTVTNVFNSFRDVVSKAMSNVKSAIESGWNAAKSFLSGINLSSIGRNIIEGLVNGIKSKLGAIGDAVQAVATKVTSGIKKIMDIHSPSRVTHKLGEHVGQGFANGISSKQKEAEAKAKAMAKKASEAIKNAELKFDTKKMNANQYINELKRIDAQYKLSGEQQRKVDKEIYAARQALSKNNAAEAAAQQKRVAEKMKSAESLYDTKKIDATKYILMLKKIDAQYQLSADLQRKLNKEIYDAQKSITDKKKQDAQTVKDYYTKLDKINDEYVAKTKAVAAQLKETEKNLTNEYKNQLSERRKALSGFVGIFDEVVPKEDAASGDQLIANLATQVDALKVYAKSINALRGRGLSDTMIQELEAQGPKAAAEIAALAGLNDAQLAEYQRLYTEKEAIAKAQATKEMVEEKAALEAKIIAEREKAAKTVEAYRGEWIKKIVALNKETLAKLGQLSPGMQNAGQNAIKGMIKGMQEMRGPLMETAQELADAVSKTIKSALKIKSPSRIMRDDVGHWIPAGIAAGIEGNAGIIDMAMQSLKQAISNNSIVPDVASMVGSLSRASTLPSASGTSSSSVTNNRTLNNAPVINVYSPAANPFEIAKSQRQEQRRLAAEWGI